MTSTSTDVLALAMRIAAVDAEADELRVQRESLGPHQDGERKRLDVLRNALLAQAHQLREEKLLVLRGVQALDAGARLNVLLVNNGVAPLTERQLDFLRSRFAAELLVATSVDSALRLRSLALASPATTTVARLRAAGVFVDGPYAAASSSRSLFLHAFRLPEGAPRLLKVPLDTGAEGEAGGGAAHEAAVWSALAGAAADAPPHLAGPVELVHFEHGGGVELRHGARARPASGVLLPVFCCTLEEVPHELFERPHLLAQLGTQLVAALAHMHAAGYVHADVKGSNVFLDAAGAAFLGDFGATVREGDPLREYSPSHMPEEATHGALELAATPALDSWLLLVTLLSKAPVRLALPPRVGAVRAAVRITAEPALRELLQALLEESEPLLLAAGVVPGGP